MAKPDIEAVYLAIGARVRMIRETLGVQQDDLAKRIPGLTRTSIVNIEAGRQRTPMHKVAEIAAAWERHPNIY